MLMRAVYFFIEIAYAENPRDGDQRRKSRLDPFRNPIAQSLLEDANLASSSRMGIACNVSQLQNTQNSVTIAPVLRNPHSQSKTNLSAIPQKSLT